MIENNPYTVLKIDVIYIRVYVPHTWNRITMKDKHFPELQQHTAAS
jgi:hypothetical protein